VINYSVKPKGANLKRNELIALLNRDLADEHAAIIRYLVHAWLEGEETPIGSNLLSRSREEMWHMDWLGTIIGRLGGEPDFKPAPYPYDPSNRATIFKSYVEYEEKLIPHYNAQAEMVQDPHIRRVLLREAWESAIHARKFQKILRKLSPEEAAAAPRGGSKLPDGFISLLQKEVTGKYNEMLQHLRHSWVFEKNSLVSWRLMDQSLEKMKQIAHFAEDIGGGGTPPKFKPGKTDISKSIAKALAKALDDVKKSQKRHIRLRKDSELKKHEGLVINLDLTIQQEQYQAEELEDMKKGRPAG
jgi:bacterioferritin